MDQEKVWDTIAKKWNQFRSKTSPEITNYLTKRKGKILDIGCGSGRNLTKIKGLEWNACDFSKEMLKHAKERAKKMKMEVKFRKANSLRLPYKDKTFDHCILYAVLHCIKGEKQRIKTLKEMNRVLKPKGSAIISVWGEVFMTAGSMILIQKPCNKFDDLWS